MPNEDKSELKLHFLAYLVAAAMLGKLDEMRELPAFRMLEMEFSRWMRCANAEQLRTAFDAAFGNSSQVEVRE